MENKRNDLDVHKSHNEIFLVASGWGGCSRDGFFDNVWFEKCTRM